MFFTILAMIVASAIVALGLFLVFGKTHIKKAQKIAICFILGGLVGACRDRIFGYPVGFFDVTFLTGIAILMYEFCVLNAAIPEIKWSLSDVRTWQKIFGGIGRRKSTSRTAPQASYPNHHR